MLADRLQKNKERIQKFKETGDSRYIYQNELDKVCFQHDMVYADFTDLTRITASDKILRDKAFIIARNPQHDGYQHGLVSMVYKFFDKKSALFADKSASGGAIKNENISNEELAEELPKTIIRNFKKRKIRSTFIDNICRADLADMQSMSQFNKGILFCYAFLIFSANTHRLLL